MRQSFFEYCKKNNREDLLDQWDNDANFPITPQSISRGSSRNIWWHCEKGHLWQAAPYVRIDHHSICPVCSGKKIVAGENDLKTIAPEVAMEWNEVRNGDLRPETISPYSHKKVWWTCHVCGNDWIAVVKSRTSNKKTGCPYCSNRIVKAGVNDLSTTHPELAKQWHPTKNEGLTPQSVTQGSSRKVWWQCVKYHEWQATIATRAHGRGCPVCTGKAVVPGENDLESQYPDIAKEWNFERNESLLPGEVTTKSNRSVWWRCEKGHEFKAVVASRTMNRTACPYCTNHKVLAGFNDLTTTHPEIAAQWHPEKNIIMPTEIHAGTGRKVWWICSEGHEYQSTIYSRTGLHTGCPICANKVILPEENSLAAQLPKIAKEWHPTKNGTATPFSVGAASNSSVWWRCAQGHEWKSKIVDRTIKNSACPICINRKVLIGFNDLATTHPKIAQQWHPTMNGALTPEMFTYGSTRRVWWRCDLNHVWKAPITRRTTLLSGCPTCAGRLNSTLRRYYKNIEEDGLEADRPELESMLGEMRDRIFSESQDK